MDSKQLNGLLKGEIMEIKGSISKLLKGLENADVSKDSFVGKPINDSNGNKIGVITKVDIDNDTWYGRINVPLTGLIEEMNGQIKKGEFEF